MGAAAFLLPSLPPLPLTDKLDLKAGSNPQLWPAGNALEALIPYGGLVVIPEYDRLAHSPLRRECG